MKPSSDKLVTQLERAVEWCGAAYAEGEVVTFNEEDVAAACVEAIATIAALQSRLERVTEAHRAILAIDGPYCDSCHSQEICEAFRISKQALSTQDEAGEGR
jgi:hypothetical protein